MKNNSGQRLLVRANSQATSTPMNIAMAAATAAFLSELAVASNMVTSSRSRAPLPLRSLNACRLNSEPRVIAFTKSEPRGITNNKKMKASETSTSGRSRLPIASVSFASAVSSTTKLALPTFREIAKAATVIAVCNSANADAVCKSSLCVSAK